MDRLFTTIKLDWSNGKIILLKVYSSFLEIIFNRTYHTIDKNTADIKFPRLIFLVFFQVPADEIETLERFRNQSEPVYMFILVSAIFPYNLWKFFSTGNLMNSVLAPPVNFCA